MTPPRAPARRATITEVAKRAAVSIATVSRVLSGNADVTPALATRVRRAARALDYQPNRLARSLRSQKSRSIGVVIPDIQNPFFTSVVRGIEEVLQAADHTLLLGNSDEIPGREELYLSTLRAEGVAGLLFVPINSTPKSYTQLARGDVPIVAVDRMPLGMNVDLVTVDNARGAHDAVTHLARLGHRRIALVGGPAQHSTARERHHGYLTALAEAGLRPHKRLVRDGNFREDGGYWAMRALLDEREPATAAFVANNLMTMGALRAIHQAGLRIPTDIALVGFDDMPWATSLEPPLTAVAQPAREIGAVAAQLLLSRMREPGRPPQRIELPTQLVVRASCGTPRPRPVE